MMFRSAKCLDILLAEVDKAAPKRSRASDGWIGDAAHATRDSDHNPWVKLLNVGIVTARDFTHDPSHGCDAGDLAERIRKMGKAGDQRVKYVIWNRRIASVTHGFVWRTYTGSNPHDHHCHVSVSPEPQFFDSVKPWRVMLPAVSLSDMQESFREDRHRVFGRHPRQTRRVQRALGFHVQTGRWGGKTRKRFPDRGPTLASLRALGAGRFRVVP